MSYVPLKMAASDGGVAPPLPKRPTIIRQSNDDDMGRQIPARPAPPVPAAVHLLHEVPSRPSDMGPPIPARPAPPVPSSVHLLPEVPSRPSDKVTTQPQPLHPARPSDAARSKPLPPSRPPVDAARPTQPLPPARPIDAASAHSGNIKFVKPGENSRGSTVNKRPEITIVSARPMTDTGFRDNKPSATLATVTNQSTNSDALHSPMQPPAPSPRVAPRGDKQETLVDVDDSRHLTRSSHDSRGAPPPVPQSLLRNNDKKIDIDSENDGEKAEEARSVPFRGPPPTVPRPAVIKPNVPTSVVSQKQPPAVPGRPLTDPQGVILDPSSERNCQEKSLSPPTLHGVPPPVPRSPSEKTKTPSPSVPFNPNVLSPSDSNEIHTSPSDRNPDLDFSEKTENSENVSELYAVINKPKRPTIIRPSRPVIKSTLEQKVDNPAHSTDNVESNISPTPRLPRYVDSNLAANSEDKKTSTSHDTLGEDTVPEFLRKKLKPTVDYKNEGDESVFTAGSGSSGPTAHGEFTVPLKPKPMSSRGPPPEMKPKPSVLPKSAKPLPTASLNELEKNEHTTYIDQESGKKENNKEKGSPQNEQNRNETNEFAQAAKSTLPKRPTIIRPHRAVKFGSVENVSYAIDGKRVDSDDHMKTFNDDSAISSILQSQPPLPNKRPVSMINIQNAVEEESKRSEYFNASSSKSSENISETLRPKPLPRPAARTRPVSMRVPPMSRPPLPSTDSKTKKSNLGSSDLPPRPLSKPQPPSSDHNDEKQSTVDEISNENMRTSHLFGVSVLPRPELDQTGPTKPFRGPQKPRSAQKSSESSEEEEFVTAKEKPDRPSAAPARKLAGSGGDDVKKPPRPGAPPPPRNSLVNDSPDKDDEDKAVKARPPKPGNVPIRPVSMPVKSNQPAKSQRPRQRGYRAGKKGAPLMPSRPKPGHPLYFYMMQVPHGIALHDYSAQQQDELSFKAGDIIILVQSIDTDWILGKVDEREGMFPRDFVKVKMPLPGEKLDDDNSSTDSVDMFYDASAEKPDNIGHGPRCRARFDFDGDGPDDLVFEEGDVIRLVERVGLEWRKGEINGTRGLFPLSFVEIIEDLAEETDVDTGSYTKAIFDFDGEVGELVFQAGESIHITHMVNEEWLFGEIGDRKGQFPVQFVDHVPRGLPSFTSNVMATTEDISTETKTIDQLWDYNDNHLEQSGLSKGSPTCGAHSSSSSGYISMGTSPSEMPYCIALYDYPAQTAEDLDFSAGDCIEIVERISTDWLKGKIGGKIGMFPSAFVEVKVDAVVTSDNSPSVSSEKVTEMFGIALYEFHGEAENELTFEAGARFVIEEVVDGAEDWRWGVIDGHKGMFPAAFVNVES